MPKVKHLAAESSPNLICSKDRTMRLKMAIYVVSVLVDEATQIPERSSAYPRATTSGHMVSASSKTTETSELSANMDSGHPCRSPLFAIQYGLQAPRIRKTRCRERYICCRGPRTDRVHPSDF